MAVFLAGPYSTGCACSREKCSDDCWFYRKHKPKLKPITHADKLRAMSDEELADFIARQRFSAVNPIADILGIDVTTEFIVGRKNALDWLRQEAKE